MTGSEKPLMPSEWLQLGHSAITGVAIQAVPTGYAAER
jgi:hypothetical protein